MKIEVCVDNYKSIDNSLGLKIDRLEICSALALDGLTPSMGLVKYAKEKSQSEIHVMIRPNNGNFIYSENEKKIMLSDVEEFLKYKIDGIVIGALTVENKVDPLFLEPFVKIAKENNIQITFHRAIDLVEEYLNEIKILINLGFDRILTSGHLRSVYSGITKIQEINNIYGSEIDIMAGGGIRKDNIKQLVSTGINNIHLSASVVDKLNQKNCLFQDNSSMNKVFSIKKFQSIAKQLM